MHASGWNHVRLVVSGARMDVFVNGQAAPALRVDRLEGDAAVGSLQLRGDATVANLVLAEGAVDGLSPAPLPDPVTNDPRYLRHWRIAPTGQWQGREVGWSSCPADTAAWRPLDAGRKGFVDVGREHATRRPGSRMDQDDRGGRSRHDAPCRVRMPVNYLEGAPD